MLPAPHGARQRVLYIGTSWTLDLAENYAALSQLPPPVGEEAVRLMLELADAIADALPALRSLLLRACHLTSPAK
eukprot:gene42126-11227_t